MPVTERTATLAATMIPFMTISPFDVCLITSFGSDRRSKAYIFLSPIILKLAASYFVPMQEGTKVNTTIAVQPTIPIPLVTAG